MLSREQIREAGGVLEIIDAALVMKTQIKNNEDLELGISTNDEVFTVTGDLALKVLAVVVEHYEEALTTINV